jgi:hypothetical protein
VDPCYDWNSAPAWVAIVLAAVAGIRSTVLLLSEVLLFWVRKHRQRRLRKSERNKLILPPSANRGVKSGGDKDVTP